MAFMTIALPLIKSYTGILAFAVVYGVGDGIFITTMNSLLMFTVDEKRRAAALGLGSSLLSLGIAGGPPLAGEHAQYVFCIVDYCVAQRKIECACSAVLALCFIYERSTSERKIHYCCKDYWFAKKDMRKKSLSRNCLQGKNLICSVTALSPRNENKF